MVFSSLLFLFGFLPIFFAIYYATPSRFKNLVALIASCLFYSWGAANVFGILVVGLVIDYVVANRIAQTSAGTPEGCRRRKWLVALSVAVNIGALGYYKYANFFVSQVNELLGSAGAQPLTWEAIILPIGISFFTFHKISYVVDVYREVSKPAGSFVTFALYVLLFPQLIAGPIIRYHDVADQLVSRKHTPESIAYGAFRFCIGLAKKVLIANQIAVTADLVFAQPPGTVTTLNVWLGILCYTFQIYFDFSGYSDMALGLGHMMGISFRENFDCPYRSLSITEFWRRWHISLSSWMKEYLYVPLGGNRVSTARMYCNLWIVFLLSGLWHGANWTFIVWGIFHGSFLVIDKLFWLRVSERAPKVLRAALTFFIVLIGWVFFRSPDLDFAMQFLGRMFAVTPRIPATASLLTAELLNNRAVVSLCLAALISFAPVFAWGIALSKRFERLDVSWKGQGTRYATALLCLFLCGASLANSAYNPFIYFRF